MRQSRSRIRSGPAPAPKSASSFPAAQSIGYAFESSAPVDFNIHFHRGKEVVYPVKADAIPRMDDRFTAPSTEEFCLMWTNRTLEMVTVKGTLSP